MKIRSSFTHSHVISSEKPKRRHFAKMLGTENRGSPLHWFLKMNGKQWFLVPEFVQIFSLFFLQKKSYAVLE